MADPRSRFDTSDAVPNPGAGDSGEGSSSGTKLDAEAPKVKVQQRDWGSWLKTAIRVFLIGANLYIVYLIFSMMT